MHIEPVQSHNHLGEIHVRQRTYAIAQKLKEDIATIDAQITNQEGILLELKNTRKQLCTTAVTSMIEFASTLGIDRDAVLKLINKNDSTPSHDEALLATELSHTGLNFRTTDILSKSGIRIVGELCSRSSAELLQVGIFGRNHLEEVRGLLASYGLTLRIPMSLQADSQMSLEEIPDSGLSPRTVKALRDVGITTLAQLCSYTRKSLLAKENIGRNTLEEIKEIFTRCGLTLPSE